MADYDKIADQAHKRVMPPINKHIRQYNFFNIIGDFSGKSILDLACGDGLYTRMFKPDAAKVTGVDISEKMIGIARRIETENPLGIEYLVGDVIQMGKIGEFDLVTAVQLLHYAQTKEQLLKMCRSIYANLKTGGRFITINANFDLSDEDYRKGEKYGIPKKEIQGQREDGTPITMTFTTIDGQQVCFDVYYLGKDTYKWAFETAGFKEIHWHKPLVSPEGIQEFGQEFWQNAIDYPMNWYIECVK